MGANISFVGFPQQVKNPDGIASLLGLAKLFELVLVDQSTGIEQSTDIERSTHIEVVLGVCDIILWWYVLITARILTKRVNKGSFYRFWRHCFRSITPNCLHHLQGAS